MARAIQGRDIGKDAAKSSPCELASSRAAPRELIRAVRLTKHEIDKAGEVKPLPKGPPIGGFLSGLIVFIPCLLFGSTRFTGLSPFTFAVIFALINDVICQISYNFVALPIIGKLVKLPYWVVLSGVMLGAAFNSILFAFLVIPIFSTLRLCLYLCPFQGRWPRTVS